MNVIVVMTGDEEDAGRSADAARARRWSRRRKGRDVAIGFEDGPGDPKFAVTARRGTTGWELTRHRHAGAFVADLPRGHRLRRGLRGGADPERVPREDGRRAAPDVQSRRDPRRHGRRVRSRRSRAAPRSARRTSIAERRGGRRRSARAVDASSSPRRKQTMQRDRGGDRCRTRLRRSRSTKGIRRWRRPTGNAQLLALYDQASRDLGFGAVDGGESRSAPAPPTCRSSPARCR